MYGWTSNAEMPNEIWQLILSESCCRRKRKMIVKDANMFVDEERAELELFGAEFEQV